MNNWAVLTSAPGQELQAQSELALLGIDAYCPVIKHMTKPKRKSSPITIIAAAFPGYLFAREGFTNFSATPLLRASKLHQLRLGDNFCTVSEDEIDRMRDGDDERTDTPCEIKFSVGDHIRIKSGPLVGLGGEVTSINTQRCELAIFGMSAKVQMPTFSIEMAEGCSLQ